MEVDGALNAADALHPEKTPAPVEQGLGGLHKRSKHFGEQKNLSPCRDSNPVPSSRPPNRCTDRAADGGVCSYCGLLDPNAVLMLAAS
jgi:hypothetical protein